jgi:hypothetical protein
VSRTIKAGELAIAAIVGAIVVLIVVVAVGPEVQNSATPVGGGGTDSTASSTAAPGGNTANVGSKGLPLGDATPSEPPRGKAVRWKGALGWDGFLYADGRWIYSDGSK